MRAGCAKMRVLVTLDGFVIRPMNIAVDFR